MMVLFNSRRKAASNPAWSTFTPPWGLKYGYLPLFLCLFLSATESFPQQAKRNDSRLPSKVLENVNIMRETVLDQFIARHVNIEEDVRSYIRYELKRIEEANKTFEGIELYYLGILYSEVGFTDQSVNALKEYIEEEGEIEDKEIKDKARASLTKGLIKLGKMEEATGQLEALERSQVAFLDLLCMEMAKGYAKKKDEAKALFYARKSLKGVDPAMSGFLMDHLLAHFVGEGMCENGLAIVDDLLDAMQASEDQDTKEFLRTRRKQLEMIGQSAPMILRKDARWVGASPPPVPADLSPPNITILYFWTSRCEPSIAYLDIIERIESRYGERGLRLCGVTRCTGYVKGAEEKGKLDEEQEIQELDVFCGKARMTFSSLVDENDVLAKSFFVKAPPHLVVLNHSGQVRFFCSGGGLEAELLEEVIEDLLEAKALEKAREGQIKDEQP